MDLLLFGGLAVGVYFLWNKVFGPGGGGANSQNNSSIQANSAATVANDLAASQAAGVQQSTPDSTLNGYATSIFQLIGNGGGPPVDDGTSGQVLAMIQNLKNQTDWYRLVQLFGTKQYNSGGSFSVCALTGMGCDSYDLPALLRLSLPAQGLIDLNNFFLGQGMQMI